MSTYVGLNKHAQRAVNPLLTDHQHGPRHRASRVPAEQVVALFVLRITGAGNDLIALHLALTGGAFFAFFPLVTQARAVDLDAADATLGVGLGAGRGAACKRQQSEYYDNSVHSNPY